MRSNSLFTRFFILQILLTLLIGCVTPKKLPSVFDANPDFIDKRFTQNEIANIQIKFKTNPDQYSQEYGNLILWQMHQKSPELGSELSKIPELSNGISPEEAKAIFSIYKLIKNLNIPKRFFNNGIKEYGVYEVLIEWSGSTSTKSNMDGCLYPVMSPYS